ncbi:MAG: DUF503 domain-containing protein [Pseudonocardiales bacterium]|nr:MAG: DUF503 domain-containing protein [Pseudonocardiales bacterium]
MFVGSALFDVLLPAGVASLKEKRAYVRPVVAALRRLDVAVAEVGGLSLYQRVELGVASVAADAAHVRDVLDACEHLVEGRPELELLSVRRQLRSSTDEEYAGHG